MNSDTLIGGPGIDEALCGCVPQIRRGPGTGDCFVPLDHQALIVGYLDDLTARLDYAERVGDIELRNACAVKRSTESRRSGHTALDLTPCGPIAEAKRWATLGCLRVDL